MPVVRWVPGVEAAADRRAQGESRLQALGFGVPSVFASSRCCSVCDLLEATNGTGWFFVVIGLWLLTCL